MGIQNTVKAWGFFLSFLLLFFILPEISTHTFEEKIYLRELQVQCAITINL